MQTEEFIRELASKSPTPGGGGASALIGATSAALCSMVANLTIGKKKYELYRKEMESVVDRMEASAARLISYIRQDADAFEPLAAAYSLPKDAPGRDNVLEESLRTASSVPLRLLEEAYALLDTLEALSIKGTRIAVSDIGVAAAACRAAGEGAAMNIYTNTKLMKDRLFADDLNETTDSLLKKIQSRCDAVYRKIQMDLREKNA